MGADYRKPPEPKHEIKVSVKEEESSWVMESVWKSVGKNWAWRKKTVTRFVEFLQGWEEKEGKTAKTNEEHAWNWKRAEPDMELQGDRRAEVVEWMKARGVRPVLAGG